ncbi:MBL fold metallo-hydrolase [Pontibacillus litoralis]|uniref:Beta-lactamase n=1 Tax=Pontibacillus litoralis JSM 072002 TaxID=1385512 RepID=A0A0A5G6N5_9BACI|nr:MBL fold metallo-hydrolase [Pontibacillus litoralis]KGX87704.1 beta-lactamase [Pontibacillus litoralis JSM 072002]
MQLIQINDSCYYIKGTVNIGYVKKASAGMLIDAGLDAQTMKKVLNILDQASLPVTHLFITHAHSDHYGGGSYLQQDRSVYTFAPYYEEAILRYPSLEPLYLFGGNDPLPELRNKFLEGKPIFVDEVLQEGVYERDGFQFTTYLLPGHSYYQLGILIHQCFYAGDAYFGEDTIHKHKIPFLTDAYHAIQSLYKVKEVPCVGAVPGHGEYEVDFHSTVDANIAYHHELLHMLKQYIEDNGCVSHESVIAYMCETFQVTVKGLSQWLLFRTAVTAYLLTLLKQDRIEYSIERYHLMFKVKGEA